MAIVPGSINGEESATVTFKVRSVTVDMNSTVVHQEVLTIGDQESTLGLVRVRATTPNSTDYGMVVRAAGTFPIEGNSTVIQGTSPWIVSGNSTIVAFAAGLVSTSVLPGNSTALNVRPVWSSSNADQPVSAGQAGIWTVQPGNTANTTAWKVDGSAVTQPVSAASLPLPTGAATAAKQPALGTAGAAAADVVSIQGIASMTPIAIQGNSSVVQSGTWNIGTVTAVTAVSSLGGVVTIQGNSTVVASQAGIWTMNLSTNVLSTGDHTVGSTAVMTREVVPNILTYCSTTFGSTSLTILSSAATTKGRVVAYSITSTHTAAVDLAFYKNSTMIWPIVLQAVSSAVSGANLAVSAPAYLFQGSSAKALTINTSVGSISVRVAVSYYVAP